MGVNTYAEGPIWTRGRSFHARAEAHARRYRAKVLKVPHARYGHLLKEKDAERGANFLDPSILQAVKARRDLRKGVNWERTSGNLLSSQAMCFSLFVPLERNKSLAAAVLGSFIPNIKKVRSIEIEYTPLNDIFNDQSGPVGVDCDVLARFTAHDGEKGILTVETKYVEKEFSGCGFRRKKGKDGCPPGTVPSSDFSGCRYHTNKNYRYWTVTARNPAFAVDRLATGPCPFGGNLWQLWVNLNLSFATAEKENAKHFHFAVIAPRANEAVSEDGEIWSQFTSLLQKKSAFTYVPLEDLVDRWISLSKGDAMLSARWFREKYIVERDG